MRYVDPLPSSIMILDDLLAKVLLVLAGPMIEFAFASKTG